MIEGVCYSDKGFQGVSSILGDDFSARISHFQELSYKTAKELMQLSQTRYIAQSRFRINVNDENEVGIIGQRSAASGMSLTFISGGEIMFEIVRRNGARLM